MDPHPRSRWLQHARDPPRAKATTAATVPAADNRLLVAFVIAFARHIVANGRY
jgi:hypothetical protein